jgi:iron complex transport system substrate-binding protein
MNRIFRVILILIVSLLISVSLFAGGQSENSPVATGAAATGPYPMTVLDGLGTEMVIGSRPDTIASLTLFTDEVLLDMIGPERIRAVTFLASDETYSNIADRASMVPQQLELNVESLIDLYPDIIFVANWSDSGKVAQLREAGLTVFAVNTPTTVDGIREEILRMGEILGAGDEAGELVADMDRRLGELKVRLEEGFSSGVIRPLGAMDYSDWGSANGAGTTWQAMLGAAGVENAVAELEAGDFGQVPVSKELLVELNPDVLVLPGYIWGDPDGADAFLQQVTGDPALAGVAAIQDGRVFMMPERLKSTYSQYFIDGAYFVARQVYPEIFQE